MQPAQQKIYTVSEAAKILGVSSETLRRWDRQGKIKIGRTPAGYRVFSDEELENLKHSFQPQNIQFQAKKVKSQPRKIQPVVRKSIQEKQHPKTKPYTTLHSPKINFRILFFILIFLLSNAVSAFTLWKYSPVPEIMSREYKIASKNIYDSSQALSENLKQKADYTSSIIAREYNKFSFFAADEFNKMSKNLKPDEKKILEVAKIPQVQKTVLAEQSNNNNTLTIASVVLYSPTNQIINSSFEGGLTGYSIIGQSTNSNTKVGNESVRSGTQALRIEDNACVNCQLGVSQVKTQTINGRNYILTVYIRVKDLKGDPKLRIGLFGTVSKSDPLYLSQPSNYSSYSQDRYEDHLLSNLPGNEWVRLSSSFENLSLGKYPIIEVIDYEGGAVYIDDLSLNEGVQDSETGDLALGGLYPQEINNAKLADNTIIADSYGNLYPSSPFSGSIGIDGTRFSSLYTTKLTVDNSGNLNTSGTIQAKEITVTSTSVTSSFSGDLSVEGNTTLGDATTDTVTINPATITLSGGNKTLDLTGAATRTLTILNSTASQVADLDLSDGSLKVNGTSVITNARAGSFTDIAGTITTASQTNITAVGTLASLTVTGNINSSTGALQTNGVTRIDNSGNLTAGTGAFSGTVTVGSGTGKITVGTIDPPYTIEGEKYATYLSSMTGVNEETAGTVKLDQNGKYEIEFSKLPKGSNLWLFYQVTDFGKNWENLTAVLSPNFDGRVWYIKDFKNRKLTIYGNISGEVSYHFISPRFDHLSWQNTRTDEAQGFVLQEKQ